MKFSQKFDVIVIGGGHAGTEAALASARRGAKTLLLTHNIETIGQMSCNPAIGGIGKGHLVKEIDAMGGAMAMAIDKSGIQFRTLNSSKGHAVRATRAQADRVHYKAAIHEIVEAEPNLTLFQQGVDELVVEAGKVLGAKTSGGICFYAKTVVLTVGTFLAGKIHIGDLKQQGGRAADQPAIALSKNLRDMPFNVGRLKTGTPPRIDGRTIDYSKLEEQPGDMPLPKFSFWGKDIPTLAQLPCHIARTNQTTHNIITDNISRSAMYSGDIEGTGPRYCPSIEDKVVRFSQRDSHQIFIEPEGLNTYEVYPNGISTSLPFDVQVEFVRSMVGFENAHIMRPGYAIEYDFFDPRDLKPTLESKYVQNLFFAGQINGTTGYEEAGAQGLVAGTNAAANALELLEFIPDRTSSYIGVLIDDLITLGTKEPYRMFTSRAEYRLLLREDNADLRLCETAYKLGLLDSTRYQQFINKQNSIEHHKQQLKSALIRADSNSAKLLAPKLKTELTREYHCDDLLRRPELSIDDLTQLEEVDEIDNLIVKEQVEIQIKYEGYIGQQQKEIDRLKRNENLKIPSNIDYAKIKGLSNEVIEKLQRVTPHSIGQASRVWE